MDYRSFVKEMYPKFTHLPVKQRLGAIAEEWKSYKTEHGVMPKPKKEKKVKGGLITAAGLDMESKKKVSLEHQPSEASKIEDKQNPDLAIRRAFSHMGY